MITPEEFLKLQQQERQITFRMGKIPSNYTVGRPQIVFDGESVASTKQYTYLAPYTPTAGDKVLMAFAGGTYVILGKIV